jgi:ribosomal protein L24E
MPTCSFCRQNYKEPRGLTIFTFDGRAVYYCSSKCRRNAALKRDPKKTNWVRRRKGVVFGKAVSKEKVNNIKVENPIEKE